MLRKEADDVITYIFYEDTIESLKEQIRNCEEEDIRLNNDLQVLEAQETKDYTESSLVRERISQLVRPLNIEEADILQEENELAIMHQNQQEQQQIDHIRDQIKLKESLIENLKCVLNALNQELEILHLDNNYLSLHDELSRPGPSGVNYNHQHDIIHSEEVETEYAHRLAYSSYAPSVEKQEEDIELIGVV